MLIVPILAVILFTGCVQQPCQTDANCPEGQSCVQGYCQGEGGQVPDGLYPQIATISDIIPTDRDGNPIGSAITSGSVTENEVFHLRGTIDNPPEGRILLYHNGQANDVEIWDDGTNGEWRVIGLGTSGKYSGLCHVKYTATTADGETVGMDYWFTEDGESGIIEMEVMGQTITQEWTKS